MRMNYEGRTGVLFQAAQLACTRCLTIHNSTITKSGEPCAKDSYAPTGCLGHVGWVEVKTFKPIGFKADAL